MKTSIKELVQFIKSFDVVINYHQKDEIYKFTFYGDLYRHKDGYLQSYCSMSTTNVDTALELMNIASSDIHISDISMMQRTFNMVSDSIKFDYRIEGLEIEISTQLVK